MSRNIGEVINKLNSVTTNDYLKESMSKILYDAGFKAPEVMYQLWNRLQFELFEAYDHPFVSEESLEAFSIFTGRTKEELLEIKQQEEGHYN